MEYEIIINNVAQAKQRPRFSRKTGHAYTPTTTQKWEYEVREAASRKIPRPTEGPVEIEILFIFPRPKNRIWKTKPMPREWKTTRPDLDNLEKSTIDGLNGVAFKDDGQVCSLAAEKVIAAGDEIPRVIIHIRELGAYSTERIVKMLDKQTPEILHRDEDSYPIASRGVGWI